MLSGQRRFRQRFGPRQRRPRKLCWRRRRRRVRPADASAPCAPQVRRRNRDRLEDDTMHRVPRRNVSLDFRFTRSSNLRLLAKHGATISSSRQRVTSRRHKQTTPPSSSKLSSSAPARSTPSKQTMSAFETPAPCVASQRSRLLAFLFLFVLRRFGAFPKR